MSNAGADKMTSTQANLILNGDSINSWQKTLIRAWEALLQKNRKTDPIFYAGTCNGCVQHRYVSRGVVSVS